ncbi:MAG: hypothetical protein FJY92_07135, partial [Candidatus Hydrogenedentes bacterium]|nr:hypothetical protein [Candidatus Hydrogenedentota bacterium]
MASSAVVRPIPIQVGALDVSRASDWVVGRTELVERLWRSICDGGVCVTGARHMGKTWALQLAATRHPAWAKPIFLDVGACQGVAELVWRLAQGLSRAGVVPGDWYGRVDQWYSKLGVSDGNGKPAAPWTMVLNGTLQHASMCSDVAIPTIVLDGFGAFVDRLCQAGAIETARRFVDAIAAFPNDWPRLRCVISGSGELDDALRAVYGGAERGPLRAAFAAFNVPPLDHGDAQYLAACLLKGESVPCSDLQEVAEAIATTTGENPFLIHNTIDWMARFQPGMWTPDRVRDVPTALWVEPTDADDTRVADELIDPKKVDDELVRAASVLETLAQPAPAAPPRDIPRDATPHPVLNLPPAFVLLKDSPGPHADAAGAEATPAPRRADASALARTWRRVQSLAQAKAVFPTAPASFYVTHDERGVRSGDASEPTSFVAFAPREAAVAGMQALAEARKALLELEDTAPVLGIEGDESLFKRGTGHLERGQFDAALDMFQEIARRHRPGECAEMTAGALLNAAYALSRLRRHEDAIGVDDALVRQYGEDGRSNVLAC